MNNAIEKILKIHYNVSSVKAANIIFLLGWAAKCGLRWRKISMIKKFLECTTVRARIDMLSNTFLGDWSEQDLNIILSALGFTADDYAAKADKISAIEQYLADYKRKVERENTMNCEAMDKMPVRDEGETIYREKGFAGVLKNALEKD